MKKGGALELSIGTIVIVILAVAMLILGLLMTKNIMCSSIDGIQSINENTRGKIVDMFTPEANLVIKEVENSIAKGASYGVGFAIRNNDAPSGNFRYDVAVSDIGDCEISESEAEDLIIVGKSSDVIIPAGEDYVGLIKFSIPKSVTNCNLRYGITVTNDEATYDFSEFDVKIVNKKFTQNIC